MAHRIRNSSKNSAAYTITEKNTQSTRRTRRQAIHANPLHHVPPVECVRFVELIWGLFRGGRPVGGELVIS